MRCIFDHQKMYPTRTHFPQSYNSYTSPLSKSCYVCLLSLTHLFPYTPQFSLPCITTCHVGILSPRIDTPDNGPGQNTPSADPSPSFSFRGLTKSDSSNYMNHFFCIKLVKQSVPHFLLNQRIFLEIVI